MSKTFNPKTSHPARAVQAWQILVCKAMNRQTVTYDLMSQLMYRRKASGVLAGVLGHIALYCRQNDLPPLTAIVVNSKGGLPGDQIPVGQGADLNQLREKVYRHDWFDVYPPSEVLLRTAYGIGTKA